MATLTIRNLDDSVKQALRERAARNGRSMEEEARILIRHGMGGEGGAVAGAIGAFYDRVRAVVEPIGGVELEMPQRQPSERPVPFSEWASEAVEE